MWTKEVYNVLIYNHGEVIMNIWNQQSQHDFIADVMRSAPAKKVLKRCGRCRSYDYAYAAKIGPEEGSSMLACRCERCGTEWIDAAVTK